MILSDEYAIFLFCPSFYRSLVGALWVLAQVLRDDLLEGLQLVALHIERLLDYVIGQTTLQVQLEHQRCTRFSLADWLQKPASHVAEGPNHALRRVTKVVLLRCRRERHNYHATVRAKCWMLDFGHVMHEDEISRADNKHAFSLLIDHVGVGRDFAQHIS